MSKGWFAPPTASALRDHIRGEVLTLFLAQATEPMRALDSFEQAKLALNALTHDPTQVR